MTPIAAEQVRRTDPTNHSLQVTPNFWKPSVATWWGTRYLQHCLKRTDSIEEALMMYNGGFGQVMRYRKGLPLAKETRKYVPKVLLQYYLQLY